jgi:hypothetical protein
MRHLPTANAIKSAHARDKSALQMKSEQSSDEVAAAMTDLIQPKTWFSTSSIVDGLNHKVT